MKVPEKPQAQEKSLNLTLDIDPEMPRCVMGDPGRLRQVIMNLAGNAVKFTESGDVSVRATALHSKGPVNLVEIEVSDTGIGIKQESLITIFDKFTQADNSTTRQFGGTGLGLAITKQLVEMMGGEIKVDSSIGFGSTFTVRIPFTEGEVQTKPSTEKHDFDLLNEHIIDDALICEDVRLLIVEDDEINREVSTRFLKKLGITNYVCAVNGKDCLEKFEEGQFNLILMDCQMPEMDGYEATQIIRSVEEATLDRVPIIATTANAMVGDKEKCIQAGMDDYISKPLKLDSLKKLLSRYVAFEDSYDMASDSGIFDDDCPPVDLEHFATFAGDDWKDQKELFELFILHAKEDIKTLLSCLESEDVGLWRQAAHKLKGASSNLGAQNLMDICELAEHQASQSTLEEKHAQIETIQLSMGEIEDFYKSIDKSTMN